MNKFTNPPDSILGLVGLFFWIGLLAGGMALLFSAFARMGG